MSVWGWRQNSLAAETKDPVDDHQARLLPASNLRVRESTALKSVMVQLASCQELLVCRKCIAQTSHPIRKMGLLCIHNVVGVVPRKGKSAQVV
jgi:hypothetical protein